MQRWLNIRSVKTHIRIYCNYKNENNEYCNSIDYSNLKK